MPRSEIQDADRDEVARFIEAHWGDRLIMCRGCKVYPHTELGFIERRDDTIVGLLTYRIDGNCMEILTLNSTVGGQGIGSSLMLRAIQTARENDCTTVTLVTTNDNLRAIGFYQRLGFRMMAINLGAVDDARKIKSQIPETDKRGVPIRDEIVMELSLQPFLDDQSRSQT